MAAKGRKSGALRTSAGALGEPGRRAGSPSSGSPTSEFLLLADLVDRLIRDGNDVEVPVGALLDVRRRAEPFADDDRLGFLHTELDRVVHDALCELRVGQVQLLPVAVQPDPVNRAARSADLLERAR